MKLFKAKEKSECFQRICCPADIREFKINIEHDSKSKYEDEEKCLILEKE